MEQMSTRGEEKVDNRGAQRSRGIEQMSTSRQTEMFAKVSEARRIVRGVCPECGVEICDYESEGMTTSEYMGEGGVCWGCR